MARRYASFFPQRLSSRVPNMVYVGATEGTDLITITFPAIIGADTIATAGTILTGLNTTAAGSTTTFDSAFTQSELQMNTWGRQVILVASGAATNVVTINGRDYLGSRMTEAMTVNGTTGVVSLKCFRYIDSISWTAAAVTVNIGITNNVGIPFKQQSLVNEVKDGVIAANVGQLTAPLATGSASTSTSADVRGRYAPATVLFNGSRIMSITYLIDKANAHGNAQFAA